MLEPSVFLALTAFFAFGAGMLLARRRPSPPLAPLAVDSSLAARVEKLEQAFPAWKLAVDNVLDEVDDVLDRVRKRKASIDGRKAHEAAPESTQQGELDLPPETDREKGKRAVFQRFNGRG